jgi:HD superfamily phosphodiesterase
MDHVNSFYTERPHEELFYHNYLHVNDVAEAAKKIADHYQLSERDRFIVGAATWLHDIGYLLADPRLHEEKSAELAEDF